MIVLRFYTIVAILAAGLTAANMNATVAEPILAPLQHRPPPPPDPLHLFKKHPTPPRRHPRRVHVKLPHIKLPPHPGAPPHP